MEREEIARTLADTPFEEAAERLLNRALENGGKDNITFPVPDREGQACLNGFLGETNKEERKQKKWNRIF